MSHRGMPVTQVRRTERRKQAEARQTEYDKLSLQQKLERLPENKCRRERARLLMALDKQHAPAKQISKNDGKAVDAPGMTPPDAPLANQ